LEQYGRAGDVTGGPPRGETTTEPEGWNVATIGSILMGVGVLINLVCFILVLIKMFGHGKTLLAVVCIVLTCCGSLGMIIGFIYGWVKSTEWNIRNTMLVWTLGWVMMIAGGLMNPGQITTLQEQIQQQQHP
jgi:hypothetical protein